MHTSPSELPDQIRVHDIALLRHVLHHLVEYEDLEVVGLIRNLRGFDLDSYRFCLLLALRCLLQLLAMLFEIERQLDGATVAGWRVNKSKVARQLGPCILLLRNPDGILSPIGLHSQARLLLFPRRLQHWLALLQATVAR